MTTLTSRMSARTLSQAGAAVLLFAGLAAPAHADLDCKMSFNLKGWSAFYKTASGHGVVRCSDGSSMNVRLHVEGGGISFGKTTIDNGRGEFTGLRSIRDALGDYVSGSAHGGAGETGSNTLVTKGEVSLGLTGTGRGWDIGVDFSNFSIEAE